MARKPTGNPIGPPPKEIDWTLFEQLCSIQCTQSEMASMLKVCEDTLRTKVFDNYGEEYSAIYKKYSETGKCSLRRNQFVLSKSNNAMAIWLGKQWLGQRDHNEAQEAPKQDDLKLKEQYYAQCYKNQLLEKELNDLKCKANQVVHASDSPIQSVDRSGIIGEDVRIT